MQGPRGSLSYALFLTQKLFLERIRSVANSPSSHVIVVIRRFFCDVIFPLIRSVYIWLILSDATTLQELENGAQHAAASDATKK